MPDSLMLIAGRFAQGPLLASGGMGDVFAGHDQRDDRPVAIKRVRAAPADATAIARAAQEGAILRATAHPSIVHVLAVVDDPSGPVIVMERVGGGTLAGLIAREGRLPLDRVLHIALDLADALARAHRLGIVHRDLKPDNVLLADDGSPRLTDFGISSMRGARSVHDDGALIGTAPYLPPEAWDGEVPDARADIWAFGVMLYEMLAGHRPFSATLSGLLHAAIATVDPVPIESIRADVPPALARALRRMLAKRPADRMASIRELGLVLDRLIGGTSEGAAHAASLPRYATPLVGRRDALATLRALLASDATRLVTLTGPGGCGKTRLAVEVATSLAADLPDGVQFVDLSPIRDHRLVLPAIARALGVEDDLQASLVDDIARSIGGARRLLVLDNMEQVIGAAAEVARLVAATPRLTVLVTSRFPLHVSAERLVALAPLEAPDPHERALARLEDNDAVRLFVTRARARRPDFALDATAAWTVGEICRRLDGLPLAIELAAARAHAYPPAYILGLLAAPLAVLGGGEADRSPRQQTLRATIAWSVELLAPDEARTFARLAAFAGAFTFDDALAVAAEAGDDAPAFVDRLQALVERHLVVVRHAPEETRYALLDTVRAYAAELLAASAEHDAVAARHAAHFAARADGWGARVAAAGVRQAIREFNGALADFRAMLTRAEGSDPAAFAAHVAALGRFWYLAGHWNEARAWDARALAVPAEVAGDARCRVLDELARLEMFLGDEANAILHHEEAHARAAASADRALAARTAEGLGEVLLKVGDIARATRVLEDAVAAARALSDAGLLADCLTTLATARVADGRTDAAEALLREAERLVTATADALGAVRIHYYLAGLALLREDLAGARAQCESGIAAADEAGETSWGCHLDEMLGRVRAEEGDHPAAARLMAHSLQAFHAVGSRTCLPHSFEAAARLGCRQPDVAAHARAAHLLGAADGLCAELRIAMLPVERALFVQTAERVRALVPTAAFEAEWNAGRERGEAAAVALALASLGR
ncbi:MAG: protein kinase [Gemmatimonadetes bacterium]|nr:protein kinase [Gemmatimonadota bacterium]